MTKETGPAHGLDDELVPEPEVGRRFTVERRVRWGDADRGGRLRLDAVARYLQDTSNDDTRATGEDPSAPWIVRRTRIDVDRPPRTGDVIALTTFAGGLGSRWAERRTSIAVPADDARRVEAASLWVRVDPVSGRPARLDDRFLEVYGEAARGRTVGSRLRHPGPPDDAATRPWPLRSTDHDALGHVNNASTWEAVEDELDRRGLVPRRAELEYRDAITPTDDVVLHSALDGAELWVWLTVDGRVRASAAVRIATG